MSAEYFKKMKLIDYLTKEKEVHDAANEWNNEDGVVSACFLKVSRKLKFLGYETANGKYL